MDKREVLVKHLAYALTAALERLIAKDLAVRAFVIVHHASSGRFLQFATHHESGVLLFDVPQLAIVLVPCDDVADGVTHADLLVSSIWAIDGDETLTITEDENKDGPRKRLAKWWKKLRESLLSEESA